MVSSVRDSRGRVHGVIVFLRPDTKSEQRGRVVGGLDQGRGGAVLSDYLGRGVIAVTYSTEYNTLVIALLQPLKR